ncbi:ABC transporter ATP-binding protein [Anaerolentibacter hominis]|uniref:ABC transporter ATP-binding protein n=1 Tax=Anaerolentibacter hominis TaxID=3079009 RepID=UPI0031B836E0
MVEERTPVLEVEHLSVSFRMYHSALEQHYLKVISDLNIRVCEGEIVAIAGSSGSGKSLLAHAVMGLLPENSVTEGEIRYRGELLDETRQASLRGREMALVPQSVSFLDPLMKVRQQVQGAGRKKMEAQKDIFHRLGLEDGVNKLYPFQLSGGMARRVLVSTAVISDADLIIADEPTPGMDAALAREALNCFRELADSGKAVLLITHDIDIALEVADRIGVFYGGTTLELADAADFHGKGEDLRHPYSRALWNALPQNGFAPIPGFQPYAGEITQGCLFAPRCGKAAKECRTGTIPMRRIRDGEVRCLYAT